MSLETSPDALSEPPSVELRNITKRYGHVTACDEVSLKARRGTIHGLLGENGAGKSTLVKVLVGLAPSDGGDILLDGKLVDIPDPIVASNLGIGMVHQHFSLVNELTVWENVTLGEAGRPNAGKTRELVHFLGERYGLVVDPNALVGDLSMGQRQRVEIIKCLRRDPQIIILDEPTSVLTSSESLELFEVLHRVVKDEGRTVILISHKLDEIMRATDEVTIMRSGRVVAGRVTAETDERELAREMVGRDVSKWVAASAFGQVSSLLDPNLDPEASVSTARSTSAVSDANIVMRIDRACLAEDGRRELNGLSLVLRAGEITGLAGIEGNGQHALVNVLSSLATLDSGEVLVDGALVPTGRPGIMQQSGVGVIPDDRHESGCVLDMSVAENLVMSGVTSVSDWGFVRRRKLRSHALRLIRDFDIATPSPDLPMRHLSGGNQQKVVLARELASNPKVLVAAYPTRGLDIGAIEYMSNRLFEAALSGIAVLLISTELEEILSLSNRVAVIHRGAIVGEMLRADLDAERLGMMMGGQAA